MSQWTFVVAAYAAAVIATLVLLALSFAAMRRAEREAEQLRAER